MSKKIIIPQFRKSNFHTDLIKRRLVKSWLKMFGMMCIVVCCYQDAAVVIMWHICFQDDEMADRTQPISEPIAPPKKETAWERGLKLAREVSTIKINSLIRRTGVFSFQRATGSFVLPFTVLKWQNRTGDNMLCFTIGA